MRWPVAAVAALVVVGGLASWQVAARIDVPLTSASFAVRGARPERVGGPLRYDHGASFRYVFDVTNVGEHSVTVTRVPLALRPERRMQFLLDETGVLMGREPGLDSPPVPFQPFELRPGESRLIYIEARFANCRGWWGNDLMGDHEQAIWTSRLGVESKTLLRFAAPLRIRGPAFDDCPARPRGYGPIE